MMHHQHHLLQIVSVEWRIFCGGCSPWQAMSNEQRQGLLEFTTGAFTVQGGSPFREEEMRNGVEIKEQRPLGKLK